MQRTPPCRPGSAIEPRALTPVFKTNCAEIARPIEQGNSLQFVDSGLHASTTGVWSAVVSDPVLRNASSSCAGSGSFDWDVQVVASWTAPTNATACPRGNSSADSTTIATQADVELVWQYVDRPQKQLHPNEWMDQRTKDGRGTPKT